MKPVKRFVYWLLVQLGLRRCRHEFGWRVDPASGVLCCRGCGGRITT